MLRITIHDEPETLTFQLEGTLVGPWVGEAAACWQRTLAERRKSILSSPLKKGSDPLAGLIFPDDAVARERVKPLFQRAVRFDLTSVTMIDAAGKALLTAAHAQGVEFIACGCLMRAIVAELTKMQNSGIGCRKSARDNDA